MATGDASKPGPQADLLKIELDPEEALARILRPRPKAPEKPKRPAKSKPEKSRKSQS